MTTAPVPNAPVVRSTTRVAKYIIGVCGRVATGKTVFILQAPGPVLILDFEGSSVRYEELQRKKPVFSDFTRIPVGTYEELQKVIMAIKPGQYRTIGIDTFSGAVSPWTIFTDEARKKYSDPKLSGLMWGEAKARTTKFITTLATLTEYVIFTAHMRNEYAGSAPTGRKEAKFPDPVWEGSDIILQFERNFNEKLPTATLLKSRELTLSKYPRIPKFSWARFLELTNEDFTDWEAVAAEYEAPVHEPVETFLARLERMQTTAERMTAEMDADA